MKDLDELEARFRSEVDGYKPIPPAFIWDEISRELRKDKKGKRQSYFWIFLGLLICSIIVVQKDRFTSKQHDITNLSNPNKSSIDQHAKEDHHEKIIDKGAIHTFSNTSEIIITDDSGAIKLTGQVLYDLNHKAAVDDALIIPRTEEMLPGKPAMHSTALSLGDNRSASGALAYNPDDQNEVMSRSTAITKVPRVNTQNAGHENLYHEDVKLQDQSTKNLDYLPLLEPSVLIASSRNNHSLTLDCRIDENNLLLVDEKLRQNRFFFEIGMLIGRHNTNLRSAVLVDSFYRSNSESNWYTWGAKARVGFRLSQSFFVKTGIDFIESRDKFDFRSQHVFPSSNELSSNGIRFYSVGGRTYRQLNIPLTLSAEKTYGKFFYGVEGTLLFNFRFNVKGKIQTGLESVSRVEDLDIYKKHLGLGYTGALILGAHLNEDNSIYCRPTYTRYASTISVDNADVISNLSLIYVEFGLRKELR